MNRQEEREKLIEADQNFVCIPPPDYSKMTNEEIRKRTEILEKTFEYAFEDDDEDEDDDDL
ncbi:hypothetical protein M3689_05815 [Alkalihalophilus marmarensis]|uniref:hypothetical protein n=1 Tax=Alkalihalophilus marmarensis TaxID=521377 RepID=UPI00203C0305|nr:hypothetical protein [Alkalihalophilus marmarensis]MCM3488822.1 hypothetical protein [Alkalihalophilus marmarensis]